MSTANQPTAFVIMPFASEFDEVYRLFISNALNAAGYKVLRADNLLSHRSILQDIIGAIASSDLIIADLTGANPNVFYELGIAHALGKPVIMLTQDLEEIPFDLQSYRVVIYETHFAKIERAIEGLTMLAKSAADGSLPFGNPVKDFLGPSMLAVAASSDVPQNDVSPAVLEEDDRGFLDHLIDLQEGYAEITATLEEVTGATQTIGQETIGFNERITRLQQSGGSSTASGLRLVFGEYSTKMDSYSEKMAVANSRYEEISTRIDTSLESILSYQDVTSPENRETLASLIETLMNMGKTAMEARDTYTQMRESLRKIEGMERNIRRSAVRAGGEVERFANNIGKTIASVMRGIEVAKRRLESLPDSHA
jgi:hypothetical protein